MGNYLRNIWETISTMVIGMKVTMRHIVSIRKDNVTLQRITISLMYFFFFHFPHPHL